MRRSSFTVALGLNVSLFASSAAMAQQAATPANTTPQPPATTTFPATIAQQPPTPSQPIDWPIHYLVMDQPNVRQCPNPDWIKPGARLTFFSASASVQGAGGVSIVPDPAGDIVDSKGRRYKENPSGSVSGGVGGAGYTIVDVVAVEPGAVVLETRTYLLTQGMSGPLSMIGEYGVAVHPSGCDYFLHPKLLKQIRLVDPDANDQGVSIMRSSEQFNGKRFDALRFTVNAKGRGSTVYDLTSGVMLSYQGSAATAASGLVFTGTSIKSGGGGNTYVMNRFVSSRELKLPWLNQQMPDWVRVKKHMSYAGTVTTKGPPNLGIPDVSLAISADIKTTYVGRTWSAHEMRVEQQSAGDLANDPIVVVRATGPGSIGGMWMDPRALQQLRTGQVLDQDSTLASSTAVEYVGNGNDGRPVVVITTTAPTSKGSTIYDATDGKLLSVISTETVSENGFVRVTQLSLASME